MSDERHTAELAIMRAQRDALAMVVWRVWGRVNLGGIIGSPLALRWMIDAGLVDRGLATREQAERLDVQLGEITTQLSAFGRAAMAGVKR
jgi:hypothetical protein